ncbi:MAG TPA: hypothetical protein VFQ61_36305 [Polyangiaceae bacterium]|nr:hypothetical protein [Polyangiaceae bacterium]
MGSDTPREAGAGDRPLGVLAFGILGTLMLAGAYFRFRTGFDVGTLEKHAALGDALAPAGAFLSLLAVFAALWAVQVQRADLALQRQELRETRKEMEEQRKQFERTARAQESLAAATGDLANRQSEANRLSQFQELAQRRNTLAMLYQVIVTIDLARLQSEFATQPHHEVRALEITEEPREFSLARAKEEGQRIVELESSLGLNTDLAEEEDA